jgi:hypothetical protein
MHMLCGALSLYPRRVIMKAIVIGFSSVSSSFSSVSSAFERLLRNAKRIMRNGNPAYDWGTDPAGVCSPEEARKVLDRIRDAVDDWRASDGGLTNAACDTRWCCSRAEHEIERLCSIKGKKALAEAVSAIEEQAWEELNEPYHECYLQEIFDCVIAVGRYLALLKAGIDFDSFPSYEGKIAVNLRHGEYCFRSRNPWYGDLQAVPEPGKIHINRWVSHDGAEQNVLYSVAVNNSREWVDIPRRNITGSLRRKIEEAGYGHILR